MDPKAPHSFHYVDGHAHLGDQSIQDLAKEYGTPLYILDQQTIERNCNAFLNVLKNEYPDSAVLYAGKANLSIGIAALMKKLGMSLDVSSGGELFTAIKAGFPADQIYFHGNNKTAEELELACKHLVTIVIDNEYELQQLAKLATPDTPMSVLLRIKPEIEAHTHEYIKTGQLDSKFGVEKHQAIELIKSIQGIPQIAFKGIHGHIGSQIFATKPFLEFIDIMVAFMAEIKEKTGVEIQELNCGGGMGIYYTQEDDTLDIPVLIKQCCERIRGACDLHDLQLPKLLFEPGRSVIGNAGITVYKVGAIKPIEGIKTYLFVDGGMADNPRPMMYNAAYSFDVAHKKRQISQRYSIAGKFCESGDILAEDCMLETVESGDLLIVFGTGAYNYSMASNYNRNCRPAMIIVDTNTVKTIIKRETYDDLIRFDCNDFG